MSQHSFKNHWIVFRKVWTEILVYTTIFKGKKKKIVDREKEFKQILEVSRPFLIIEEDEDNFLVLTLTKNPKDEEGREDKPSFKRFEPISCHCLSQETYVRLETKILMSRDFVKFYALKLKEDKQVGHQCLSESQFLELRKALDTYWSGENKRLTLVKLGMGGGKIKEKDKWVS